MESNYKINIPEPCNEDWNKMKPTAIGRFCNSCAKTVVDFTNMPPDLIVQHLRQNTNVCGRIQKSKLNGLTIQIPNSTLYAQTHYHKIFLLALFITMGTSLFSCADKNGNKQKIEKIEIVNTPQIKNNNPDTIQTIANDTLENKGKPKTKKTKIRFTKIVKSIHNEVTASAVVTDRNDIYEDNNIYGGMSISVSPEYVGGMPLFETFIKNNYEPKLIDKLKASFIIKQNGELSDVKIIQTNHQENSDELVKTLKLSTKWNPAIENGRPIDFVIEIDISITNDTIRRKFIGKKIVPKIDSINISRITKFNHN
ncbi:hypothetical protein [Flavobacterium muglaense]|uniref:TonB C-terminal domain-containing protein n=1 Tax=Flavobacterium muglaense TaxID=2764716 RepID=A0A923MZE6_9FLAO|nr:hypothetical protein [Flavobacterium muglaense]MBC5837937.1 hypothetical protein [Flavobacterium muglaense]MBC5844501.1 hypothetical protein [Flavobacterium muglaense]